MKLRGFAIFLTGLAMWLLWVGYDMLSGLRGTPLWDFRYLVFLVAAFPDLSAVEWALGRVQKKLQNE